MFFSYDYYDYTYKREKKLIISKNTGFFLSNRKERNITKTGARFSNIITRVPDTYFKEIWYKREFPIRPIKDITDTRGNFSLKFKLSFFVNNKKMKKRCPYKKSNRCNEKHVYAFTGEVSTCYSMYSPQKESDKSVYESFDFVCHQY